MIVGKCDFSRIPVDQYETIKTAVANRQWKPLAKIANDYTVCPWTYCCGSDANDVINLFTIAYGKNFFDTKEG